MTTLDGKSLDIEAENIEKLRQIFPEAFEEGKIDFDKLRQLLGDYVDDEEERYRFTWNGKGRALRLSQTPSLGTLRPCKEESKDWDTTQNLYIEGDNLEVLKLLQKSYYGKVKMIYIDPPYNTGNDFVYKDDFKDNIENYKRVTGQVDGEGHKIDTNTESNGRFHTDWLNMMYPRLRLARNLLAEDGVIFISIDDNEQENLKKICDEVFGADNFVNNFMWLHGKGKKTEQSRTLQQYVLCYAKNKVLLPAWNEKVYTNYEFTNPDNDPKGAWFSGSISFSESRSNPLHENYYEIQSPSGVKWLRQWQVDKNEMKKLIEDGDVYFGNPPEYDGTPRKKIRPSVIDVIPKNILDECGTTKSAEQDLTKLLGMSVFEYPKPCQMLKHILSIIGSKNSLILDFFSGSATTAHAVMQLNAEDGGNRKFIMVQLPEPTAENSEAAKAGYPNICEIGKERIRRAGEKIKSECPRGGDTQLPPLDIGFKVFKLDSSNIQKWNPQPKDLELALQESVNNFLPGRTELDVVYEIMLKMGLDLALPIEERKAAGQSVYVIGGGALMVCLGERITLPVAEEIAKLHKEYDAELWQVVFRDTGFASDMDKTNIKETLKTAGLDEDSFVCV